MTIVKRFRQRLEAGQQFRSADQKVEGTVVQVWLMESGSGAFIRLSQGGELVRMFVPSEEQPERR